MITTEKYKEQVVEFINQGKETPFDYLITLTCGSVFTRVEEYFDDNGKLCVKNIKTFKGVELDPYEVSKKVRFMKNRLHRELYGRHRPFGLNFIPSIETKEDGYGLNGKNTHIHLLCSHPDKKSRLDRTKSWGSKEPFERLIRQCWRQSGFGSGVVDFVDYYSKNGTFYVCKGIKKVETEVGTLFKEDCIDWENVSLN